MVCAGGVLSEADGGRPARRPRFHGLACLWRHSCGTRIHGGAKPLVRGHRPPDRQVSPSPNAAPTPWTIAEPIRPATLSLQCEPYCFMTLPFRSQLSSALGSIGTANQSAARAGTSSSRARLASPPPTARAQPPRGSAQRRGSARPCRAARSSRSETGRVRNEGVIDKLILKLSGSILRTIDDREREEQQRGLANPKNLREPVVACLNVWLS